MNFLILVLLGISLLYEQYTQALIVGSDSSISIVTTCTLFPAGDNNNTIKGFVWLKGGYQFEDATTSCTFDGVYPITGTVDLKGGTLYLLQDMVLANPTDLKGLGTIIGNGHSIEFCESVTVLPANLKTIKDLNVFFDGDIELLGSLSVQGTCLINSLGNVIQLGDNVVVTIDEDATLEIQRATLKNVNNNINCVADTSHFIIQDILACLQGYSHFTHGDLIVQNSCKITGPYTFWYDSDLPLHIDYEATVYLDGGMTLKCGRKQIGGTDPISFYDSSSKIVCGECTIQVTSTGMMLTRGRLEVEKNVTIESDATSTAYGIIFGDGVSEENDVVLYAGGGSLTTFNAPFVYNNVRPGLFSSAGPTAMFVRRLNSPSHIKTTCIQPPSYVIFEVVNGQYAQTTLSSEASLFYNNVRMSIPGFSEETYYASRTPDYSCLLNGGQFIYLASGVLTDDIWVYNAYNMISGNGTLTGQIILLDSNTSLILNLSGAIHNAISLNGGTIKLYNDILMSCQTCFSTSGTIDLGSYTMKFDYAEDTELHGNNFDCDMVCVGDNGFIRMNDNTILSSTWTILGSVTIDGNGNSFSVDKDGKLIVGKNSHVTLRNMRLNLGSDAITCLTDESTVTLDNVHWVQNEDFAFTSGSLIFRNRNIMSGAGHVFTYQSTKTATIEHDSTLDFDYRFTFSYAPSNSSPTLLQFKDFSSKLGCAKSVLYLMPGLRLTNGQLLIKDDVSIYAFGEGLTLGDQTGANDMAIIFSNRYILDLVKGTLSYKNSVADSLQMNNDSMLEICSGSQLNVYEDIYLRNGSLLFDMDAKCALAAGKQIIGSVSGSWMQTTTDRRR